MTEFIAPQSLIGILGPPRSGTTLIANAMISHPEATGIIEPYQVRRDSGYMVTDPATLLRDFGIDTGVAPHVFVKETTTRKPNVTATLCLLGNARAEGMYTGLVVILRRPLDAYLSQIEASRTMWKRKMMTEVSDATFDSFAFGILEGLRQICHHARAQHFRMVNYEGFCAAPDTELARLMALVPLRLERSQLSFAPPKKIAAGGDPKTTSKAGGIAQGFREAEAAALRERFARRQTMQFFDKLEALSRDLVGCVPDSVAMDELTRLVLRKWGR